MSDNEEFKFKKSLDIANYIVSYLVRSLDPMNLNKRRRTVCSGALLYRKNKDIFDKLFSIQEKYNIDMCGYVTFFLHKNKPFNRDKISNLLDVASIKRYADELSIQTKHQKIIDSFNKSVQYILNEIDKRNCISVIDCLKQLILENKLASLYISGKLSPHYLAGLKNFKKIVLKMDQISKDTLMNVANQQEQLLSDLRDAFMSLKNISEIGTVSYTEKQYSKLNNKNSK